MAQFKLLGIVVKTLAALTTAFCLLLTVWTVGPSFETRFFPAVSKLQMTQIAPGADDTTRIWVGFDKLRNCEYVGLTWYKGQPTGPFERVSVVTRQPGDQSNPNRAQGRQNAGPWTIALTVAELQLNSFAHLLHRCHPFWITTTDFYP